MVVVGSSGRLERLTLLLLALGAVPADARSRRRYRLADALGDRRIGGDAGAVEQRLVGGEFGGCLLLVVGGVGQHGDFRAARRASGRRRRSACARSSVESRSSPSVLNGTCSREAGGGDGHVGGDLLQRVDQAEADGVVVAPDVAAVDHAGEDGGVVGHAVLVDGGEVLVACLRSGPGRCRRSRAG